MHYWYLWGPLALVGLYLMFPKKFFKFLTRWHHSLDELTQEMRAGSDPNTGEIILAPGEIITPHIQAMAAAERTIEMNTLASDLTVTLKRSTYAVLPAPVPYVPQHALSARVPALQQLAAVASPDAYQEFLSWRQQWALEWQLMLKDFDKGMKILAGDMTAGKFAVS